jgi:ribonuclease HI
MDERTEVMGAGYVLGAEPQPMISFFARVGGPLASARAEAASLLQLLRDVRQRYSNQVHLLIFVDCLVVSDIIRKWGRSDFHPSPKKVVHVAVIYPLLQELRQWSCKVTLVKVKSHTGCLLNERADELAELGRQADNPEICPGPQNYGSFWLRIRLAVLEYADNYSKSLPRPRDSAPNRSLLDAVAAFNTLRAVKKHSTMFVTDLLHQKGGAVISSKAPAPHSPLLYTDIPDNVTVAGNRSNLVDFRAGLARWIIQTEQHSSVCISGIAPADLGKVLFLVEGDWKRN